LKSLVTTLKKGEQKKASSSKKVEPVNHDELEVSLQNAIDNMLDEQNGVFWKQSNTFAPSSGNQCPRYACYRFRGFNQKVSFPPKTRRIFDLGNSIEDLVRSLFDGLGILVDEQVEIKIDNPPIRGYIDFIVDWGTHMPVECKSINDNGFLYRKTFNKPTDNHFRQLQCYLYAQNAEAGFLFYYNKNNSEILPILVKRNDEFLEKLFEKYAKIYEVHQAGEIPERPYKQTSSNCKNCDAFDHCWADTEVGVSFK
jgi:CRISPR/Cas system-associated exonuclease Cas4 (RecB family)